MLDRGTGLRGGEAGDWLAVVCLLASNLLQAQAASTASHGLTELERVIVVGPPRPIAELPSRTERTAQVVAT